MRSSQYQFQFINKPKICGLKYVMEDSRLLAWIENEVTELRVVA